MKYGKYNNYCTKEELAQFKEEVIAFFKKNGIANLHLRAQRNYDGNIKIYTGREVEYTNRRSSFRRTEAVKDAKGNIKGWHGTRGHHTTTEKAAQYAYRGEWTNEDRDMLLSNLRHELSLTEGGTK